MTKALPQVSIKLANSNGIISQPWYGYLKDADSSWRVTVQNISTATTTNTLLPNDGVSVIHTTPPSTHTLETPVAGCAKTIIVTSTSTTCQVVSASTTTQIHPGTGWRLVFGSSAESKLITLRGTSTTDWYIVANPNSVTVST